MLVARYIFSPQIISVIVKQEFGQGFMKAPGDKLEAGFVSPQLAGRVVWLQRLVGEVGMAMTVWVLTVAKLKINWVVG